MASNGFDFSDLGGKLVTAAQNAVGEAHDYLSNSLTQSVMRNTPESLKAVAEPNVRTVVNAGLGAYGLPEQSKSPILEGTVIPEGGLPESEIAGELPELGVKDFPTGTKVNTKEGSITTGAPGTTKHIFDMENQLVKSGKAQQADISFLRRQALDSWIAAGKPGLREDYYAAALRRLGALEPPVPSKGLSDGEVVAMGGRTLSRPTPVETDGWLTDNGFIENPKGKSHKDTAVGGDTQEAIKNGHIRVATLGSTGDTLHFEARDYANPDTRKRIADAIHSSPKAQNISMEFTEPEKYKNVTAHTPESALSWLEAHGGTSGAPPAVKPGGANYQDAAKYLGIEFRGVQEGVKGVHPGVAIFQDPQSGTSVALRLDQWSPDKLLSKLRAARESMKK